MLLIVPYGIETYSYRRCKIFFRLLIVPYGIETLNSQLFFLRNVKLLIVPYGIET